jgi:hypothetical protein
MSTDLTDAIPAAISFSTHDPKLIVRADYVVGQLLEGQLATILRAQHLRNE